MTTKLTLTIEESIIYQAKFYAKSKKKSLSSIIENYLKSIIDEDLSKPIELSPIVKSLKGSFKLEKEFDYKKELSEQLAKKYI